MSATSPTHEALAQAFIVLQQASALDNANEVETAMELYTAAAVRLDNVCDALPEELAQVVRCNSEEIRRKVELLRRRRWTEAPSQMFPSFPIQFAPAPRPMEECRAPRELVLRVYWLMRLLERSIQHGAYLTPNLYVSREVWTQEGGAAMLHCVGARTRYLEALCAAINPLRAMNTLGDFDFTVKCLKKFLDTERDLRNVLDSEMGRRKDSNPSQTRSIWDAISRKAKAWSHKESNYDLCLNGAVNVLQQGQLFEHWFIYFTQALAQNDSAQAAKVAEVVSLLRHIASRLYNGVCVLLLHDMAVLTERYQGKCCKSVTKLLPVDLKIGGE